LMIQHHAGALKMVDDLFNAPLAGQEVDVNVFANDVVTAQTAEIGLMQSWLRDRNQPVPEADPRGMKMVMNGSEQVMMMPGMLTAAQMKLLDAARGPEWDRLFLTFMIQHHQGAISMVEKLFNTNGAAQDEMVFKFANDVQADQSTEIDRMKLMLQAMDSN